MGRRLVGFLSTLQCAVEWQPLATEVVPRPSHLSSVGQYILALPTISISVAANSLATNSLAIRLEHNGQQLAAFLQELLGLCAQ